MKKIISNYRFFIAVSIINLLLLILYPQVGKKSLALTWNSLPNILFMLTPIFIIIGLLDVWVPRETMMKIMGENSGVRGVLIAFLLGSVTAVPLYALLPITGILLKKGCKLSNILIFLCSSTSLRIPLLLFEVSSLGWRFTLVRLMVNLLAVLIIALTIERILTENEKNAIYDSANNQ